MKRTVKAWAVIGREVLALSGLWNENGAGALAIYRTRRAAVGRRERTAHKNIADVVRCEVTYDDGRPSRKAGGRGVRRG